MLFGVPSLLTESFQPSHQETTLVVNVSAHSWFVTMCTCHQLRTHLNVSTKCVISCSHYMIMTWLPYCEVEGMVVETQERRLPSQWPQFRTVFQHVQVWNNWISSSIIPAIFNEPSEHLQPCSWRHKRVFKAKTWSSRGPYQYVILPKHNQTIRTETEPKEM